MLTWTDATKIVPHNMRPCVVLVRDRSGLWDREFAQFNGSRWSYLGSDARCRGVQYWHDLPSLPPPLVQR